MTRLTPVEWAFDSTTFEADKFMLDLAYTKVIKDNARIFSDCMYGIVKLKDVARYELRMQVGLK